MSLSTRDHPAVLAAARHLLGDMLDEVHPATEPATLGSDDIDEVRAFCRSDRLSGLLARAVRDGAVIIDGNQADLDGVNLDWRDGLQACVVLEALLVRTGARLDSGQVRWMSTKGSAVAHLDFIDPALRLFGDVDLIVHPDDWQRAVVLLDETAPARPRFHNYVHRFGKGVTVLVDDMEVDLHRRLAVGRFGVRLNMAELFDDTVHFELAGRSIQAPSAAVRMLHACFHAALGGGGELRAVRDVAQIALGTPAAVDGAWEIAQRHDVNVVVAAAISETWHRLRLPADHDVAVRARKVGVSTADARTLRVFADARRFRRQSLTTLGALTRSDRLRFAKSTALMALETRR